MRTILFRANRKDNGELVEGYYTKGFRNPNEKELSDLIYMFSGKASKWNFDYAVVLPETVGQYTGLPDKNGKKIFEGDIVTHFINWLGKRANGVVSYNSKVASWVCDFVIDDKKESAFLADWVNGNGCEIIGNIHDNPEILGGDRNE